MGLLRYYGWEIKKTPKSNLRGTEPYDFKWRDVQKAVENLPVQYQTARSAI